MEKKEKLIFWLVISILFLVYLVLEYIGYVRNLKLRWFSHEYYSKAYSKLEKADSKNKVKVILTSYDPVKLNSILDQSVRVDDIILVEKDTEKQKKDFHIIAVELNKEANKSAKENPMRIERR
jgi:tetraacyldisaccharide-1-P 4'-kinase